MVKKIVMTLVFTVTSMIVVNAAAPAPQGDDMQAMVASCFRKGKEKVKDAAGYAWNNPGKCVGYVLKHPKACIAGTVAALAGLDVIPHIVGNLVIAPFQAVGLGSPRAEDQATAQVITAMYAGLAWYYWPQLKRAYAHCQRLAA